MSRFLFASSAPLHEPQFGPSALACELPAQVAASYWMSMNSGQFQLQRQLKAWEQIKETDQGLPLSSPRGRRSRFAGEILVAACSLANLARTALKLGRV